MAVRLRAPGFYRAFLAAALAVVFAAALTWVVRTATGHTTYTHYLSPDAILTVSLIACPLFFLVGLGAFDYWFYWVSGRPTRPESHANHGAYSWKDYFKVNTDHKVIGVQYVVTSFFFLLVGGMIAMLMRIQLAQPGAQVRGRQHLQRPLLGARDDPDLLLRDPRVRGPRELRAAADDRRARHGLPAPERALLLDAAARRASSCCSASSRPAARSRTAGPRTRRSRPSSPIGQNFFSIGVQFAGASSVATALNFLVTIITMRAPGMSFFRMPLLVWANFSTSLLVVIATPFVAASQFMILLDRALGFNFFDADKGGNVLMYQHIFWFYSHPAVYIMMLPGFGIISEIIAVKSRKPIFGYRMMAFSLLAIVGLGFTVWAHHMFTSGMPAWVRIPMAITTVIIAVPTGIKIFSWLATLWRGVLHLDTAMLFALGFLMTFSRGRDQRDHARDGPVRHPRERHATSSSPTSTTCCSAAR